MAGDIIERTAAALLVDKPRTAYEHVLQTLRRAILNGDLCGGTHLIQSEIAGALGVSKTPVREALRELAADGLVNLDAHRSGIVKELSLGELQEIYEIRCTLEPAVLRKAWPHLTNEIVDRAGELHSRINKDSSPAQWVQSNIDFHGCVFGLAPSPRMLDILNGLIAPWSMYVSASLRIDSYNQIRAAKGHEAILKALQDRDLEAGISANVSHLNIAYQTLASALSISHR